MVPKRSRRTGSPTDPAYFLHCTTPFQPGFSTMTSTTWSPWLGVTFARKPISRNRAAVHSSNSSGESARSSSRALPPAVSRRMTLTAHHQAAITIRASTTSNSGAAPVECTRSATIMQRATTLPAVFHALSPSPIRGRRVLICPLPRRLSRPYYMERWVEARSNFGKERVHAPQRCLDRVRASSISGFAGEQPASPTTAHEDRIVCTVEGLARRPTAGWRRPPPSRQPQLEFGRAAK